MSRIAIYRQGELLAEASGHEKIILYFRGEYQPGDEVRFSCDRPHALVRVDQVLDEAQVYLPSGEFTYRIPLEGDNLDVYPPFAFQGDKHLLSIAVAKGNEYRNLALNPADQRGEASAYPHATANVETRNEAVFAARNVIDGYTLSNGHGRWPYQSWGIGARTDAKLHLDFGRPVDINQIVLYLRADFPHDAWWIQGTVTLSDGFEKTFDLTKTADPQPIFLGKHQVTWLELDRLVKYDVPSAFPSLKQLEVWGKDI